MNSAYIINMMAAAAMPQIGGGRHRRNISTKRRARSRHGRVANAIRRRRRNVIAAASRKGNR